MKFYWAKFPTASITPKLHLLEDHVIKFVKTWRVGFGLLGEQGQAESIHSAFNSLKRVYANVHDREEVTPRHNRTSSQSLPSATAV